MTVAFVQNSPKRPEAREHDNFGGARAGRPAGASSKRVGAAFVSGNNRNREISARN